MTDISNRIVTTDDMKKWVRLGFYRLSGTVAYPVHSMCKNYAPIYILTAGKWVAIGREKEVQNG